MGAPPKNELSYYGLDAFDPVKVYRLAPHDRIIASKAGVPAKHLAALASRMKISKETLIDMLRLSLPNREAHSKENLSPDESERVLGMEYLIGQVHTMIEESGELEGFDAAQWLGQWMFKNVPALGGKTPASFMDSIAGQKILSDLLAMTQSGVYA
jgi:uncharacterized protein (DUF2384 family)